MPTIIESKRFLVDDGWGCRSRMERDQMLCGLACLGIKPGFVGEIGQEAGRECSNTQDVYRTPVTRLIAAPGSLEVLPEASRFSR